MRKLTKVELELKRMQMRVRASVQLEAREYVLERLNELLPEMEDAFTKKVLAGELPKPLDVKAALGV